MNEIIKINTDTDKPTVSGRELHEALEIKTPYTMWFERMCEYGFAKNSDYLLVSQICESNNPKNPTTKIIDHQITIPMAKEICMIQRNDKGKFFRQYFIAVEEQWNSPEAVMARALKFSNAKLLELQDTVKDLENKIEHDKPKTIFADAVASSNKSILVGELAKLIKQNGFDIGQKRLFEWLRENGYLIKDNRRSDYNLPTQKSMNLKLFEIKETAITHADGHTTVNRTPKVTGKGQIYFINVFCTE